MSKYLIIKLGTFDMGIHRYFASRIIPEEFLSMGDNFMINHKIVGKYTNLSRNILRNLRNET